MILNMVRFWHNRSGKRTYVKIESISFDDTEERGDGSVKKVSICIDEYILIRILVVLCIFT